MKIRFMLFKIKETDLLFREEKITKEYSYSKIATETRKRETFSEEYSKRVLNDAIATVQAGAEMNDLGCPNRVSKEEFEVTINQNIYKVDFIIDTMQDGDVQLEIAISDQLTSGISTSANVEYDNCLERLKIKLKDRLMLDWSTCIWIYDEQSESLCSALYPQIFQLENKVREFSNRALVKSLGPDWISRWGLEGYKKSVDRLSTDFELRVPEFRDIDSTMFSMTLEKLSNILLNGVVYEENVVISRDEIYTLDRTIKNKQIDNITSFLEERRSVFKNIWEDIVSAYLDDPNQFKGALNQFKKNRNHVAHNKLLTELAYKKMQTDIEEFATIINNAIEKFKDVNPSNEEMSSWHYANELEGESEEIKQMLIRNKIEEETGFKIRNANEIFEMFYKTISDFCEALSDRYYFDVCFDFIEGETPLENTRVKIATIQCNASVDKLDIYATTYVDGEMNESSSLTFEAFHGESLVYDIVCYYYNGSGYVNNMGDCVVEKESVYEDWTLENFKSVIFDYIENDLNPFAKKLFLLEHGIPSHEGEKLVSDIPCFKCGKQGISVQSDFYPVGKCCYCGTENEISDFQGTGKD